MSHTPKTARSADVVIVGGGIIGCSMALRLAQARLRVMVLDRGSPGGEASTAAAGMLAPQGETVEPDAFFDLCAASRDLYPQFVAEVEDLSGRKVGYRPEGSLLVATNETQCRDLDRIYRGQTRHGLRLERLTAEEIRARVPGLEVRCGLLIPADHWVDNRRLTAALVEACVRLGVRVRPRAEVTKLHAGRNRIESAVAGRVISGGSFVVAAGCWSGELVKTLGIDLPLRPCRGQMMEFEFPSELPLVVRSGHHYLVPRSPRRVLAGTTAEYAGFDKAVTGEGLRSILEGTSRFAPLVKDLRFVRAWAGLRPDTADHLPILGSAGFDNLFFATGHYRNGILLAPVTAQLISELLLTGSTSRPIEAYRPTRFA